MSLGDMRALLDLAEANPDDLGSRAMLTAYNKARHGEVRARVAGIDALNRASMASIQGLRDMRMRALRAFYSVKPVRTSLMRVGLGTGRNS